LCCSSNPKDQTEFWADLRTYKKEANVDYVLYLDVLYFGLKQPHYGFIATGAPVTQMKFKMYMVSTKTNEISQDQIKQIESLIKEPKGIESYLLNRRNDYDTGADKHLSTTDIKFRKDFDIKRLQKIKSYRGLRHAVGLPVRGQRTKGHFRKGKAVGVSKKKGKK